mgnify:CR=1 FL=1
MSKRIESLMVWVVLDIGLSLGCVEVVYVALPPFHYSVDYRHLNMTKMEKNRMFRTDIINLENKNMDQPQNTT